MSFVRIDDVAGAEFQQDLAPDMAARRLDRGRIGKADGLAVVADVDVVPAVGREALGGAVEGGRDDVSDVARDAGLEAFAEQPGLVPAGAVGEGIETVREPRARSTRPWCRRTRHARCLTKRCGRLAGAACSHR